MFTPTVLAGIGIFYVKFAHKYVIRVEFFLMKNANNNLGPPEF